MVSARASLPVAVIGAGPVGLAAAAHLVERGLSYIVLEAGDQVAAHVSAWSHMRLFSPWVYNTDPAAVRLLAATGWQAPIPEELPTAAELVEQYLAPLAAHPAISPRIRYGATVTSVRRRGLDRTKTRGREEAPFVLRYATSGGEREVLARAVIDASGTYGTPNPLGADGVAALGEVELADRIAYGIPDILGADRDRYTGCRVVVVGSGHSAMHAIFDLAELRRVAPRTATDWAIRRDTGGALFGGGSADGLPARGGIGTRTRALVAAGIVSLRTGFATAAVRRVSGGIALSDGDQEIGPYDEAIVATGFRPDLSMLGEVRLELDPALESPVRLAPLIDPNFHSCGSVPPHGHRELAHPEANLYLVGAKSYGRAPTFIMRTGYEQVRSVAAALAGDVASAERVELVLPETGVCSSGERGAGEGCCGAGTAGARGEPLSLLGPAIGRGRGDLTLTIPVTMPQPAPSSEVASCGCGSTCCDGDPAHRPVTVATASRCCDDACCRG
ncbi:MAG: FAD-dependent oxidoreductase [Chloroflexi bacterium]|nr:FAD-dependent oxidoreductase [Chloroflexota bacterium]